MTMEQGTGNKEHGFRQLLAWQKADDLAATIYGSMDQTDQETDLQSGEFQVPSSEFLDPESESQVPSSQFPGEA
jgi:hypothetical protein